MEITEVQINLTPPEVREKDGVHAFARIIFDDVFVIRDIKIMETGGFIRLGMPSRRVQEPCPSCRRRVDLSHNFCSSCGIELSSSQVEHQKSYIDIAHPLSQSYRNFIEDRVVVAYNKKVDPNTQLKVRP